MKSSRRVATTALLVALAAAAVGLSTPDPADAKLRSGPPANTTPPKLSGHAAQGKKLKGSKGKWTGATPIKYVYRWERCDSKGANCTTVPGATKTYYVVTGEDAGHTLRLLIMASNHVGTTEAASPPSILVGGSPPRNTTVPIIAGSAKVGELLSVSAGTWLGAQPITYSYQWELCDASRTSCAAISGAIGNGFRPKPSQENDTIRVSVVATNAAGRASATTGVTGAVSRGETLAVKDLCGAIPHGDELSPEIAKVYIVTCPLDIEKSSVLAIQPGTVIKSSGGAACSTYECSISVEGTLDAVGTASDPITFTSINDNTVGGKTGIGTPEPGEWEGIAAVGSGTLDIEHATVAYATLAVQTIYSGAVTLNDDQISADKGGVSSPNAGAGSLITVTNSSIDGGIQLGCAGSLTVTGDTIVGAVENYCGHAVGSAVESVVDVADNHVTIPPAGDGGSPAISVAAANLSFTALASNTITAPPASDAVAVNGEVNKSGAMPATPFVWEISGYATVDVPAGVTLTVTPGTVIKSREGAACSTYECSISVEGTLDAVGTASDPITFTSINDNTVGGKTGIGTPEPGEWEGIAVGNDGEVNMEHVTVAYATGGLSATTDKKLLVDRDTFAHNATALDISATLGTNAAIHVTWFDGNQTALSGTSDWDPGDASPFIPCQYIPTMSATENTYGPQKRAEPFVSPSDYTLLTAALVLSLGDESPDDWSEKIEVGASDATTTDTIAWSDLPCTDGTLEGTTVEPATPFSIGS